MLAICTCMHWSHHCVCVCVADKLSPLNCPLQCGWLKIKLSPFELSTSVWLAKDTLSPFELSTSVWLAKDNMSPFELSTSVWLAKDNLSPFELSTSVWLAITFHLNTLQPLAVNWVACQALPLGSSTCMQIECVITCHAMNTASCHIHRNLLHTLHTLTHCACKHSMYTTAKKKHPNQLGYLVGIWL